MKINRNNYEEFFLLYVDNELSAAERNAVELFVQENTDLREELNMLQQTVFNADAVVFGNKNDLLKEEITALQESVLLYIDNELSAVDKLGFEKVLNTDSAANKELAVLQQTKLQPDTTIAFANKKLLYRKERAKVIGMPWRRIAVAAVLLGIGTWATLSIIKVNKTEEANAGITPKIKSVSPKQNTVPAVGPQEQKIADELKITATNTDNKAKEPAQKNDQVYKTNLPQNLPEQKEEAVIIVNENNKKPSNNLPKPVYEIINKQESNLNDVAAVTDKATVKLISGNKITDAASNKIITNEVINSYALNTNFTEGNAEEKNNNKILYMDEDRVKKTKLGGFFRKVKRLVERNSNVQTGNSIKLAGFDIAIK